MQSYLCEEQYTKKLNEYETIFLKEKALLHTPFNNIDALEILLSDCKKTSLTDNEVREVAKMQQGLDAMYYMLFHLADFARGYGDGYALLTSSDDIVNHCVRTLYNFIKEHIETKNEEK